MIRHLSVTLALVLGLALSAAANAGAVVLWPVDPVIAAGQQSTAVWIENRGTEPVTMQIRSLGWSQAHGDDDYTRQDAVVSSPPITSVAAGARQLVRIIRRAPDAGGEHAYRLLIDELPKPVDRGTGSTTASLAVQMRYSIPLFTYGAGARSTPALSARLVLAEGARWIEIRNTGDAHARLTDLKLVNHGRSTLLLQGLAGYVLPGATRRFRLPVTTPPAGTFVAGVNGVEQTLSGSI